MLRLHVDAEGGEAAIVCRAQAIFGDVLRGFEDHLADGFGCLDFGCQLEREAELRLRNFKEIKTSLCLRG